MNRQVELFHQIRSLMLKQDPMWLGCHKTYFEKPLDAEESTGILGGYFGNMKLRWIVGFVKIGLKANDKLRIEFGSNPINPVSGKNEWKHTFVIDDIEQVNLISELRKYDDPKNKIYIVGAKTPDDIYKKRKKRA
jgi:hypothetical protein